MKLYIKFLICIFLFLVAIIPVSAKEGKPIGTIQEQIFSDEMPEGISFIVQSDLKLSEGKIIIPKSSTVYAYVVNTQKERRWHKSGFIICRLKSYISPETEDKETLVDIENEEIYLIARQYEAIDKKEAGKTAVELTATTAAAFMIPGADIAYYFTKGMIRRKEGQTRFKSGISTAYENSIFWFCLKGKPIELEEDTNIKFKEITKEEAEKLNAKIEKRIERSERMYGRKETVEEPVNN